MKSLKNDKKNWKVLDLEMTNVVFGGNEPPPYEPGGKKDDKNDRTIDGIG